MGLRLPHYGHIFEYWPDVDFFEIISENFLGATGLPLARLHRILDRYRVVLHGVSLSIASTDPLDYDYLRQLKSLVRLTKAPYFTDHLCWTSAQGAHYHELLPLPFTEENARFIAKKAEIVQDYIDAPFGLENLSSYVAFADSEMNEWEFFNTVVRLSGCHYMLDINNVYVSSVNHDFAPTQYIDSLDFSRVLQCHIAGHTRNEDGTILDTHDQPIIDPVWKLYEYAWGRGGGFPTLLERDGNIPPFPEAHAEAMQAREFQIKAGHAAS